jgi:hypothetical protein
MKDERRADQAGMRRWVHAPYMVEAQLEYVGRSDASAGVKVQTREANAWGVRMVSDKQLLEGADVRLSLPSPQGQMLRVFGVLLSVTPDTARGGQGGAERWLAAMVFDVEQPQLSAVQIDLARLAA